MAANLCLDRVRPTQVLDVPMAYETLDISWSALSELYDLVFKRQPPVGRHAATALSEMLKWNKPLVSSFWDRAKHPVGQTLTLPMRSHDLTIWGFPGTTIPGVNDFGRAEPIGALPHRIDMRVQFFSKGKGFVPLPVGLCRCVHRDTEFQTLALPIDTDARKLLPWERLYVLPRDHFAELLGMLLMLSDQAYNHRRLSFDICEGTTRKHDTKDYQKAIVTASRFWGYLGLAGFPWKPYMEAACSTMNKLTQTFSFLLGV